MSAEAMLGRVLGLLAKAESTEFPAEAEALLAKAQELMARHAIDEAMIDAAEGRRRDDIGSRTVLVEAPYSRPKVVLLSLVADANQCRAVMTGKSHQRTNGLNGERVAAGDFVMILGHESDLENVERMFAALSLHGARAMIAEPVPAGENARGFRNAFMHGYASRIGERMKDARQSAEKAYEADTGHSVALVLVERGREVDAKVRETFPRLRSSRASTSSRSGIGAGKRAANRADLGGSRLGSGRAAVGAGR